MAENNKKRKFNLGQLLVEEEITKKTDEIRESIILVNSEKFDTEIAYDEGRDKYRAAITRNDSTKSSLSFFNSKKVAYKAILMSIASLSGSRLKDISANVMEGC